ncbi:MAG: hemolysin III family protein [Dehalococcoidia bacterium]|nr:hemolysin III family protein [Dehalococcoidia bacterium]MDD5494325.1 hemolysin III family protein [Dehalococcoidia bacterium]
MPVNKSDAFSFYSHLAGAIAATAGYGILLYCSWGSLPVVIVSSIYSLSTIFLFVSSTVYHGLKTDENTTSKLRKLDHIAIFFMIAGTYTPLCYIYLDGYMRWGIIAAQWLLVILGFWLKIFYVQAPRALTVAIYVLMGWMALIPLKQLVDIMSPHSLVLLVAGGVAYTVGGIVYTVKKPDPRPGVFGFHDIFHLWILLGAVLHYLVVYGAVLTATAV